MNRQADGARPKVEWCQAIPAPSGDAESPLEVNVVFTTERGTAVALRAAASLARQLNARVRLLVVQPVPFVLPLDRPPVPVAFLQERCRRMALACAEVSEVQINVYLCRGRSQALRRILRPNSLVVVGGRRRWWKTTEQKRANALRSDGHEVIFANLSPREAKNKFEGSIRQHVTNISECRSVAVRLSNRGTAQMSLGKINSIGGR